MRWTNKLLDAVERTTLFPNSGRIVPEIDRSDIREVVLGNYRIVYHLQEHQITILTVFESHHLIHDSLIEQLEDQIDIREAKKVLANAKKHGAIPWEKAKKDPGL